MNWPRAGSGKSSRIFARSVAIPSIVSEVSSSFLVTLVRRSRNSEIRRQRSHQTTNTNGFSAMFTTQNYVCDHLQVRRGCNVVDKDYLSLLWEMANFAPFKSQNTVPISTEFWKVDYAGKMKKISKVGWDQSDRIVYPCGWNIYSPLIQFLEHFHLSFFFCFFSCFLIRQMAYKLQFATDFNVWRFKRCKKYIAFWILQVLELPVWVTN